MKKSILIKFIYSIIFFLLLFRCHTNEENNNEPKEKENLSIKPSVNIPDTNFKGVMMIEEQPVLAILDSAHPKEASQKMQENYNKILNDVKYLGVQVADEPGCIFYSSSAEKIVFETFLFLKSKPQKQPKLSQPVILEKTMGLLYDHYGTFNSIHNSYSKIEKILKDLNYKQTGPSREIYILNEDTAKWRTRIIIPVVPVR